MNQQIIIPSIFYETYVLKNFYNRYDLRDSQLQFSVFGEDNYKISNNVEKINFKKVFDKKTNALNVNDLYFKLTADKDEHKDLVPNGKTSFKHSKTLKTLNKFSMKLDNLGFDQQDNKKVRLSVFSSVKIDEKDEKAQYNSSISDSKKVAINETTLINNLVYSNRSSRRNSDFSDNSKVSKSQKSDKNEEFKLNSYPASVQINSKNLNFLNLGSKIKPQLSNRRKKQDTISIQDSINISNENYQINNEGDIILKRKFIKEELIRQIKENVCNDDSMPMIEQDIKRCLILIVRPSHISLIRTELFKLFNVQLPFPEVNSETSTVENLSNKSIIYKKVIQRCKNGDVLYDLFGIDNQGDIVDFFMDEENVQNTKMLTKDKRRKNNSYLILKSDDIFKFWSFVILTVITFLMMQLPFQFSETNLTQFFWARAVDQAIMVIFMIDIVINFCTVTEDTDGNRVQDHQEIAVQQISSWFLIDLISTIEFDIFLPNEDSSGFLNINNNFLKIFRLKFTQFFKIMRSAKLLRVLRHIETIGGPVRFIMEQKSTNIILKSSVILLFCHFLSCIQVWIYEENKHGSNWVYSMQGEGYEPPRLELQIISWQMSIQTVTTVGYGDVPATNIQEVLCRAVAMIVGTQIWSFVSASIISWTVDETISDFDQKKYQNLTQKIIKKYKIDYDGIDRISKSLLIIKDSFLKDEYEQIARKMPYNDSRYILNQIFLYYQKNLNFLQNKNQEFFISIQPHLKLIMFETDTQLDQNHQSSEDNIVVTNTMQILMNGEVGCQDFYLDQYGIVPNGVTQMFESGEIINLDKITYRNLFRFDKDQVVQENTELIEIDQTLYENCIRRFFQIDSGLVSQETAEKSRSDFQSYLYNKICMWQTLNLLKYRGAQIKDMDLKALTRKLQVTDTFQEHISLKLNKEQPELIGNHWYEYQIGDDVLRDIRKQVTKMQKEIEDRQRKGIVKVNSMISQRRDHEGKNVTFYTEPTHDSHFKLVRKSSVDKKNAAKKRVHSSSSDSESDSSHCNRNNRKCRCEQRKSNLKGKTKSMSKSIKQEQVNSTLK